MIPRILPVCYEFPSRNMKFALFPSKINYRHYKMGAFSKVVNFSTASAANGERTPSSVAMQHMTTLLAADTSVTYDESKSMQGISILLFPCILISRTPDLVDDFETNVTSYGDQGFTTTKPRDPNDTSFQGYSTTRWRIGVFEVSHHCLSFSGPYITTIRLPFE